MITRPQVRRIAKDFGFKVKFESSGKAYSTHIISANKENCFYYNEKIWFEDEAHCSAYFFYWSLNFKNKHT